MSDQLLRIDLPGADRLQQQRCGDRVYQARGNGDIVRPKLFKMKVGLNAMNANIGDDARPR